MWKCHMFLHQLWCLFFQPFLPFNRIFMENRLRKGVNNTEINPVFFQLIIQEQFWATFPILIKNNKKKRERSPLIHLGVMSL